MENKTALLFLFASLAVVLPVSSLLPSTVEYVDKANKIETMTYLFGEGNLTESPAYSIQLFSDKESYDSREEVVISAYVTGGGSIEESRMFGQIPKSILSGDVNITVFRFAESLKGEWKGWKPVGPPQKFTMGHRFAADLVEGYFTLQQDKPILWSEGEITFENKSYAPVSVSFAIKRDAPSGDHKIEFIFKYKSPEGKWSISRETITIHIRSFIEKWGIAIMLFLSVVTTACITGIFWVLSKTT